MNTRLLFPAWRARGVLVAAALSLLQGSAGATTQAPQASAHRKTVVFTVDIAEDFVNFVPGPPLDGAGVPQRGSYFITEGKIFPGGTIVGDGSTFDPSSDGSIGSWLCRGTHLVSGYEFADSRYGADTTQAYLFPDDSHMVTTEGLEGGLGVKIRRAVTGGTGKFTSYVGIQKQELLGFNASGGINLRVTFVLKKVN